MSGYVSESRERDKLGAFDVPELAHELIGLAHIDNARLLRVDLGGCNLGDALRLHHMLSSYDRRIARAAPEAQLPTGSVSHAAFRRRAPILSVPIETGWKIHSPPWRKWAHFWRARPQPWTTRTLRFRTLAAATLAAHILLHSDT
jgi:hypothetical protein